MKHILFSALFLISFVAASAQTTTPNTHRRYGCYFDFGSNPSLNIGGLVAYSPLKWARIRAEAGVLFLIGNTNTKINTPNANVDFNKPALHTPHVSFNVTPSIHLGKTFSLDFNIRSLIGKSETKSNLYFAPGFTLRYGRFEIRTRISHVETVNIGLAYFPTKKVK